MNPYTRLFEWKVWENLIKYLLQDRETEEGKYIYQKLLEVKHSGITHKTIRDWSNAGLINYERIVSDGGWRYFSVSDFYWLQLVSMLREWGVPLATIKSIKYKVYGVNDMAIYQEIHGRKPGVNSLNFDFLVHTSIYQNARYYILFDGSEQFEFLEEWRYNHLVHWESLKPVLLVPFNSIASRVALHTKVFIEKTSLTNEEKEIIRLARSLDTTKRHTIHITKNQKKYTHVQIDTDEDIKKKTVEQIKQEAQNEWWGVRIIKHNDKVIAVKKEVRKKL